MVGLTNKKFFSCLALVSASAVCAFLHSGPAGAASPAQQTPVRSAQAVLPITVSQDARRMLAIILAGHDNQRMAFAIVDKKAATVHVFDGDGVLTGSSRVLLGLAIGDDSVHGIGQREISKIRPDERTTPAGRFKSEPGLNTQGDDIVWVDYDAAVSMHRVRMANKNDRRFERLATPGVSDKRISYGCINVPAAFYDARIKSTLGHSPGVVYVLPETRSIDAQFVGNKASFLRNSAP